MTVLKPEVVRVGSTSDRYRLNRAGILNVWQYDDQEFSFADGRMLLRGTNGAGKSKTLEMLLPFVLDGDKARMTSSARHHTSLLWLMTDGYEGQARVGYLWVEFARYDEAGEPITFTCGVGIRASASARTATAWFFTTTLRIGHELFLEDSAGPLSRQRLAEQLGPDGHVFEQARAYKEHVGRGLFGLEISQYDEVLRLLYWLRQPQVGEDIEPKRLADQLLQALPQLDDQAVRAAGETFDELAAFGEQIERRAAAVDALTSLNEAYSVYARAVVARRGTAVVDALAEEVRRTNLLRRKHSELADLTTQQEVAEAQVETLDSEAEQSSRRIRQLEDSPEARDQRRLTDLSIRSGELETAAGHAERSATSAERQWARREDKLSEAAREILNRSDIFTQRVGEADRSLREAGVQATLVSPVALAADRLADSQQADQLLLAVESTVPAVGSASQAVHHRLAAAHVVRDALTEHERARRDCADRERRAAEAEERWEESRASLRGAEISATAEADSLRDELKSWTAEPAAPGLQVPTELTPSVVEGLAPAAGAAAAPLLDRFRADQQTAISRRDSASAELESLAVRRAAIEREADPAPPEPPLGRSRRTSGAALWRLVDFRPELAAEDRAGLEAALQSSGLLDAWVRPNGEVLGADQRDAVLPVGPGSPGTTLLDVLRPDVAPDGDVTAEIVSAVLSRVGLGSGTGPASVAVDGTWMLGPLHGRAAKEQAQYVGATARVEERRRRLTEVDALITTAQALHDEADRIAGRAGARIDDLEGWLRRIPPVQPLLRAWATVEERSRTSDRDRLAHETAQTEVLAARQVVKQRLAQVERLARQNEVPGDAAALDALEERLRAVDRDLVQLANDIVPLQRDIRRWRDDRAELDAEADALESIRTGASQARSAADGVAAELAELRSAVGATVVELERRLRELYDAVREAKEGARLRRVQAKELAERIGGLREGVAQAEDAVAEQGRVRTDALRELGTVAGVPGLLASAYHGREVPAVAVLVQAAGAEPGDSVSHGLRALAGELAGLADASAGNEDTAVWRAYNEAASGPAAEHEPQILEFGDLLSVTGRDEAGESAIGQLVARAMAAVEQDRRLLTDRERERFEQHILGELGDAIRRRRVEATDLVEAMNSLLADVSTSQGIRMRLDWRLREDVSAEAREAIRLLTQPVGALLPEERATLRDSLHRLIEASRAESPELSYSEHLGLALDYRRWFEFRIKYTRPESEGRWLELHRRSPLSQGEQKVLCYLPLFAAAAAHFTSLAGAAPFAPRLVLLDDAFPKIDVRTHPLLFGLLVQLDLDFVITSERLWGDHDTVPSLAIYEALRDPAQRGIAQYEYRWDGRGLKAIG
jgi:uncharacterized protein (TIGR02680 family)